MFNRGSSVLQGHQMWGSRVASFVEWLSLWSMKGKKKGCKGMERGQKGWEQGYDNDKELKHHTVRRWGRSKGKRGNNNDKELKSHTVRRWGRRKGETNGRVKIPSFLCWNMSWRQQAGLEYQHLNSISLRAESLPERDVRGTTICLCSDVSAVHAVSQQLQGKAASWPGPT